MASRLEERFTVSPTGCWMFTGATVNGYGMIRDSKMGRVTQAHRVAYREWVGPIPDGGLVRHNCDTPGCINPAHLSSGDAADNYNDAIRRDRAPFGKEMVATEQPPADFDKALDWLRDCYQCGASRKPLPPGRRAHKWARAAARLGVLHRQSASR